MKIPIRGTARDEHDREMEHEELPDADCLRDTSHAQDTSVSSLDDIAYIRLKADYENLKKRCDREASQQAEQELGAFLTRFLSIYDDFERALHFCKTLEPGGPNDDLVQGLCLIQKRFEDLLREYQLERMDVTGKKFDPLYHEAVAVEPASGRDHNTVIREILPGYLFRHKLLRPARVSVAG